MTANVVNQVPYLRTSRNFPEDLKQFTIEVNKAYVDTANAVNNRTIGIFPTGRPAVGGESWFVSGNQRQQNLRQVYPFTSTANIPHMINFGAISQFSRMWGQFTDSTNWYGLIAGSSTAIAGQISFYLTPTNIVFVSGANPPSLNNGLIVLEWLSKP